MMHKGTLRAWFSKAFLWGSATVLLMSLGQSVTAQNKLDGEKLFKANCSSCHRVDKNLVGPALKGVEDRWGGDRDKIHEWVHNPTAMRAKGDPYVVQLTGKWVPKSGIMPAQNVTDDQIDAILDYIKNWQPPKQNTAAAGGAATAANGGQPAQQESPMWPWLLIIGLVLLIIIFSLSNVKRSLTSAVREQKGLDELPDLTYWQSLKAWMWKNKAFVSVMGVLIVVILLVKGYIGLMGIGVYQGYQPEQPIAFNHMLHAGKMKISCIYCHNSAMKSRHAGIPSANVCMNCHKAVSKGVNAAGTAEIQKIYHAVGWDPDAFAYTGKIHPIKWVKVHNLPDLVYFNHAQHVAVGKIACQTCHGQVQDKFTVAKQHALLTMGWCINCHNKTAVPMKGNGYYDEVHRRLVKYGPDDLKKYLKDGVITERELGGWECAKCHY